MENNYETLRMPELKALARERRLIGYSRLRKADLIALLHESQEMRISSNATWGPQTSDSQTLTKRQLKHRRNKASKIAKLSKNLEKEIDDLKSQMEEIEDKITKATKSTNTRFKRKKIRSMKRDAIKISEKLKEYKTTLKSLEAKGSPIKHPPNKTQCTEAKISELNKKIRRAKNKKNKDRLIAKRNSLRLELSWGPRQLEGAFGGSYRRYRIDGIEGMDVVTFLSRTRKFIVGLLGKETMGRAVRSQTTTWIRFVKDGIEQVDLAFNIRMMSVYNLNDINEIVSAMIEHMSQQIENPALKDSKFVFDRIMHMDINFHR